MSLFQRLKASYDNGWEKRKLESNLSSFVPRLAALEGASGHEKVQVVRMIVSEHEQNYSRLIELVRPVGFLEKIFYKFGYALA